MFYTSMKTHQSMQWLPVLPIGVHKSKYPFKRVNYPCLTTISSKILRSNRTMLAATGNGGKFEMNKKL